ncbi:MAG: response regulator [Sediminimonas qiaohouensis]|uniref:Response regulator n=1 Tax=Sediminimonas qiaohouensis TaxID=552061 RepID=A0A7C9HMY5_9RHOB|nr:response regulator [Sediminimonas qiaohouensis]MTJ05468.1 response regulator [Sediminimonas qiaohouensis]
MRVLIVEPEPELGRLWQRHLERQGAIVTLVPDQDSAIEVLRADDISVIILDLLVAQGSALAVADYANYRRPDARVIFVTNTKFFSDGSIFQHCGNACAFLRTGTPPEDLAAMVEHFGRPRRA